MGALYVPTDQHRQMVRLLCAGGIVQERIADALGISSRTLRKHFRRDIKLGSTEIDGLAISALVKAMRAGGKESVAAAKWWSQSRMGWREPPTEIDLAASVQSYVVRAPTPVESVTDWLKTYAPEGETS